MEAIVLQSFVCTTCGWQFGAIAEPSCPRCQKAMQPVPGSRQCTIRCFASADDAEGGRKKAAA
jgi:hypothetical protein